VAFAPRRAGVRAGSDLDARVEQCLRQAALWDEVKDRLDLLGTRLSGGQQQRLTIARALSHDPDILCLDEFSIAIDPVTTMRIEDVLRELKARITIVLVTNLVQQARRLADRTMFLWKGEVIEVDRTEVVFSNAPGNRRTYDYVNGVFG
jgi:phosphate transport system ATP-binding protein